MPKFVCEVIVEAVQMTRETRFNRAAWPEWLIEAFRTGAEAGNTEKVGTLQIAMNDSLGEMLELVVKPGQYGDIPRVELIKWDDWIVKGVNGELYICRPAVFEAHYRKPIEVTSGEISEETDCDRGVPADTGTPTQQQ